MDQYDFGPHSTGQGRCQVLIDMPEVFRAPLGLRVAAAVTYIAESTKMLSVKN